jgi:hypothetical protein
MMVTSAHPQLFITLNFTPFNFEVLSHVSI